MARSRVLNLNDAEINVSSMIETALERFEENHPTPPAYFNQLRIAHMLDDLKSYAEARKHANTGAMHRLAIKLIPWLIMSGHSDREHALYMEDCHYWAFNTIMYSEGKNEPVHEFTL